MKRPSMYDKHENSLKRFVDRFNAIKDSRPLVMQIYQTENFRDDGVIVNTTTGKRVAFDWEYRDRYFKSGRFKFDTLGQFERKIKKDEIGLSLQCDSDETSVLVAWHSDFLREVQEQRSLRTDYKQKEKGKVRYTRNFQIIRYDHLESLREMILQRLHSGS